MDLTLMEGSAPAEQQCLFRVAGDDWREGRALSFQWGRYVPAIGSTPASVVGYDIAGYSPVGRLLIRTSSPPPPHRGAPPQSVYQFGADLTVAAGTAVVDDAPNGKFSFTPLRSLTSELVTVPFGSGPAQARLFISAKLLTPRGSLNTIRSVPIVVLPG